MAVNFPADRETSIGPLDVAKNAGGDNVGFVAGNRISTDDSPLDATAVPATDAETLARKNPLGYTVTPPTDAEIEDGDAAYRNSADRR